MDSVIHLSHMQLGPPEYSVVDWIDIYAVDSIIHCSNNYRGPGHKCIWKKWDYLRNMTMYMWWITKSFCYSKIHIFWSFYWLYNALKPGISITFCQLVFFFFETYSYMYMQKLEWRQLTRCVKNTVIHQTQHDFFVSFNLLFRTQPQAMIFVYHNPV